MIESEIAILKELEHPNITPIYEVYGDSNRMYLVTDLCEGGELFDRILEMSKFDEKMASYIIKQTLEGINYVHK